MADTPHDPWFALASRTPARIALGRTGVSLPTREVLSLGLAHARARDAVHADFDRASLASELAKLGLKTVEVESEASDRQTYLRRPDLGRELTGASQARLRQVANMPCDLAIMIGDGLSATAAVSHAPPLLAAFLPLAAKLGLKSSPAVLAAGARVALGDAVGATLKARLVIVLIGERPGLSTADSLGIYLTYDPRPGRHDAERNCISNIHADGLSPAVAAHRLVWLVEAALTRRLTGVGLKDESDGRLLESGRGLIG